jgi:hypothetical protein
MIERFRYPLQIACVVPASAACVLITDAFHFRSYLNLVWMVGVPIIIATTSNTSWGSRCVMILVLAAASLTTSVLIGVNFTSYS